MQKCQHDFHRQKKMIHRSHKFEMHIERFPLFFTVKKNSIFEIEKIIIVKKMGEEI